MNCSELLYKDKEACLNLGWRNKGSDVFLIFVSVFEVSSVCCFSSEIVTVGTERMESVPVKVVFLLWHEVRRAASLGVAVGKQSRCQVCLHQGHHGSGIFLMQLCAVRSESRTIYLSATERCRHCLGMFCKVHGLQTGPLVAVYTLFIVSSVCRMHNCIERLCISISGPIEITVSQTPALPFLHCTGPNVPLKLTEIVCGRMAARTTSFVEMRKCIWILKLPKILYLNRPRYFEEACLSFLRE